MAGKNQVLLTFAGDSTKLQRTFENVGAGAKSMGDQVGESASSFDRVGESADNAETRFAGLASGIDGVTTLMDDPSPQEFAQGLADMADGIGNFVVPALKTMGTQILTSGQAALTAAATHATAAATTVAGWIATGAAALVSGAQMALAWLIGLGPIALVILAIGAVIGILAALGIGFDDVKRWAQSAWDFVTSAAAKAKDWLARNWPLVLAILTGPFGLAVLAITRNWDSITSFFRELPGKIAGFFSGLADLIKAPFTAAFGAVKSAWNNTVGGFGFSTPSWVPGLGGKSFSIPSMHTGGLVTGAPGSEQLRILQAGEGVFTARQMRAMGPSVTIVVQGSLVAERDIVQTVRDELVRGGFGGAFG